MESLESTIIETVKQHSLLKAGDRVAAAVSGGPDSVALLLALSEVSKVLKLTILAAHANHQLRGDESDEDQRFVEELCERLGVRLESKKITVDLSGGSRNLEDAARLHRYSFLAEFAHRERAILATGHNRDDQAETFLMKLFRGAGPAGLSGIFMKRQHRLSTGPVTVIRPLLEVTRREILYYLKRKKQPFREDPTNSLPDYDRNWIRHQLLPTLEGRFGSAISRVLSRNATLFAEIEQHLEIEAEELLGRIGSGDEGAFEIDLREFCQSPLILRRQMARSAIREVKGDLLDITQNHILALLDLSSGTSGRQIDLPGGVNVSREFDSLWIRPRGRKVAAFRYDFRLPGELYLPEVRKKVFARRVSVGNSQGKELLSPCLKQVFVRNRRPGDRYLTTTRSSEKGLKRLFLERRVPISARDRLVMFESEGKLIWIEGFPLNPAAKVGDLDLEGFEIEVASETFGPVEPSK